MVDRRSEDKGRTFPAKCNPVSRAGMAVIRDTYYDILYLFPSAEFVEEERSKDRDIGTLRFREDALIRHLVDSGKVNLNDLVDDYYAGKFSIDDLMKFYQGLGYSLCGFTDIFGAEITVRYERARKEGLVR